jgi:aspartate/methionine/tyrosine aminotransferase
LRELIAHEGKGLQEENVVLTAGAAMALFIVHTSLLKANDHIVVLHPNYSSNLAVPRAMGCAISPYVLDINHQWELDIEALRHLVKPETRLLSLTYPHNPTGKILSEEKIVQLVSLAEQFNFYILFDETYRDACFETSYPLLASYHPRFITVLSFSKGYGLPGIRIGALICRDQKIMETFLAAKEMIHICNPPLEEAIAFHVYKQKQDYLAKINLDAQANLAILKTWLARENRLQVVLPGGGVVCYARINIDVDYTHFHRILMDEFSTLTGPGHWFDMPDHYLRIGFGYPDPEQLKMGLQNISAALDRCVLPG